MSEEEVERRELTALARRMGTLIRKELLIRHALTAKVNLPIVKRMCETVNSSINLVDNYIKTIYKIRERGEEIEPDVIIKQVQMIKNEMDGRVIETNKIISIYNNIMEDLAKEKIYCVKIEELPVYNDFLLTYAMVTKAGEILKLIKSFFQELERYEELLTNE